MKKTIVGLLCLVFISVFILTSCNQASQDVIKIGAIMPVTGPVAIYGTQSRNAIKMAEEEINQKGILGGKKIKIIVEDDEANPEKTLNAFSKLVTKEKVIAVIGALTSKCSVPLSKEAQKRKILMITPTSTNDDVTKAGDLIFRACYKDSIQAPVIAQFAYEKLNAKNAAVMFDSSNDYSVGMKDNFIKKFEQLGGKIVASEAYGKDDTDFSAQLTKIKGTKPDVIFLPDYYSKVALIAKQVRQQGIDVPMLGGDGWDEITSQAGDEVIGCYYTNHYSPDADDAEVKDFVKRYKEKYNEVPNALAALAYDSTYILAEAIDRAGSTKSDDIKKAMMQTDKKYVTGHIKFDEERNPIKPLTLIKIVKGQDGKLATEFAGTVNP